MVEIKNVEVFGLENSLIRSGYPMRTGEIDLAVDVPFKRGSILGKAKAGSGHDNYLKGVLVQFDIKYSLYFTKQLQRYTFMDFVSSQSTMHTITKRGDITEFCNKYVDVVIIDLINELISDYNQEEDENIKYELFMKIVSNLPSGFELWAGMTTNYLQLKTIYSQRKSHKLKEDWGLFCDWIIELPYFKDLVL